MAKEKWMTQAFDQAHIGMLHKQLGIKQGENIPKRMLNDIVSQSLGTHVDHHTVTPLMKKRAQLALNARRKR